MRPLVFGIGPDNGASSGKHPGEPGFLLLRDENNSLYFLATDARWNCRSVEGFRMTALLARRPGWMSKVQWPSNSLSHAFRFGALRRERFTIRSRCLSKRFSARTVFVPPGPRSRATVDRKSAIRRIRFFIRSH